MNEKYTVMVRVVIRRRSAGAGTKSKLVGGRHDRSGFDILARSLQPYDGSDMDVQWRRSCHLVFFIKDYMIRG